MCVWGGGAGVSEGRAEVKIFVSDVYLKGGIALHALGRTAATKSEHENTADSRSRYCILILSKQVP